MCVELHLTKTTTFINIHDNSRSEYWLVCVEKLVYDTFLTYMRIDLKNAVSQAKITNDFVVCNILNWYFCKKFPWK